MRRDRYQRPAQSGGGGRKMGLYASCLVVACGAGYWLLHTPGGDAVPVVTADARPIRVRPENPGGMSVNQAENFILSGDVDDSESRLAAPPEAPNTKALRASEDARSKSVKPAGNRLAVPPANDSDG